jgi:hypothetical protein
VVTRKGLRPRMKVGLVMTVRDEQVLLRRNVLYHHHVGVDEFYVYADDPADRTVETVADLPFVHAAPSVPRARHEQDPAFRVEVAHYHDVNSRQNLNVVDALDRARQAGIDWLLHVDADELIGVPGTAVTRGGLRERLAALDPRVDMAVFTPLEIVQTGATYDDVFAEATLFKRAARSPRRRVLDPITGRMVSIPVYYGHVRGKSGVRVKVGARPAGMHRFRRADGAPLRARTLGFLLHYYAYSFADFVKKFERVAGRGDRFVGGQLIPLQKRMWSAVVNASGMSREAIKEYYDRWVVLSPRDVARLAGWGKLFGIVPVRPPVIVEVSSVSRACRELAAGGARAADAPGASDRRP